nr:MAG TPA: hypothetical protein [Caudoviricetes sp.]
MFCDIRVRALFIYIYNLSLYLDRGNILGNFIVTQKLVIHRKITKLSTI